MEKLKVYYGLNSVGVWPESSERNAKKEAVIQPRPNTPANVEFCKAVVASEMAVAACRALIYTDDLQNAINLARRALGLPS